LSVDELLPVSVIMPVFNDARFVEAALRSVADDAHRPAEIIVVDNGSTDGSAAIVEALAFPGLRLVRHPTNIGATAARKLARSMASQPFICHLDSDDRLGPDALALATAGIVAANADISLFRMVKTDIDGRELWDDPATPRPIDGIEALKLSLGTWRIHSVGVYRKSVMDAADERFEPHGFSDDELLTRMCFAAAGTIVGNDGRYYYRTNTKAYNFTKIVGQTRTNIRSTALGLAELGPRDPAVAAMRAVCVRNLVALAARALRAEGPMSEVKALHAELHALDIPWRARDARVAAMAWATRALLAVR
jgi:glycosyltransferase involved in cell wall biosynthesis